MKINYFKAISLIGIIIILCFLWRIPETKHTMLDDTKERNEDGMYYPIKERVYMETTGSSITSSAPVTWSTRPSDGMIIIKKQENNEER